MVARTIVLHQIGLLADWIWNDFFFGPMCLLRGICYIYGVKAGFPAVSPPRCHRSLCFVP